MNIGYLIPLVCFWHTITTEISKYKDAPMTNNIVSFIHCVSFIIHYNYSYNLDYAVHISLGFYIYDLLYIFSCLYRKPIKDEVKRHAPFIIHHIAGMYVLNSTLTGESQEHILTAYNIIERSNIMLYVSYYLHKQYSQYSHLNTLSNFIQLLSYSYFRLIQLSLYIYNNRGPFFQFHFMTQFLIIAIYCMGVVWSHRLLKKNIANYNTLIAARSKKYSSDG